MTSDKNPCETRSYHGECQTKDHELNWKYLSIRKNTAVYNLEQSLIFKGVCFEGRTTFSECSCCRGMAKNFGGKKFQKRPLPKYKHTPINFKNVQCRHSKQPPSPRPQPRELVNFVQWSEQMTSLGSLKQKCSRFTAVFSVQWRATNSNLKNHWRFSSRTESQGLRLWRTQAMIFGIKCPGVNPSEKDWPHDKRSACPVRGEEPRSTWSCKSLSAKGCSQGPVLRPPRGTRFAASSQPSSKSRARSLRRREVARAPGFVVTVATCTSPSPLCRHRRHFVVTVATLPLDLTFFFQVRFFAPWIQVRREESYHSGPSLKSRAQARSL